MNIDTHRLTVGFVRAISGVEDAHSPGFAKRYTLGAYIITYTILGVPYYTYSIIYPMLRIGFHVRLLVGVVGHECVLIL